MFDNYHRNKRRDIFESSRVNQRGDGFHDIIQGITKFSNMAKDLYTGDLGTTIKNILPNSDKNARPSFKGELHSILKLPNGKLGVASYQGPNTNLIERLKRKDPPRTATDAVSKQHDIHYALATTTEDIRNADKIMSKKIEKIAQEKKDHPININQARLITAKMVGEDLGLIKDTAFSGDLSKKKELTKAKKKLLLDNLEGEGKKEKKLLPADRLKLKILEDMKLSGQGKGSGLKLSGQGNCKGSGLKLSGQGTGVLTGDGLITDLMVKELLPPILKELDIKEISPVEVGELVKKALSSQKTLKGKIKNVSKVLMSLFLNHHLDKNGKKRDLKLSLLKTNKKPLLRLLEESIVKGLKLFTEKKGSGLNLAGGRLLSKERREEIKKNLKLFAQGFAIGFKKVLIPALKVAPALATALGAPEAIPVIEAISGVIKE